MRACESVCHDRKIEFVRPSVPKPIEDLKTWLNEPMIKEFIKQRRIFTTTESLIDNLKGYSLDDLQHSFDEISALLLNITREASPQKNQLDITGDGSQLAEIFGKSNMRLLLKDFSLQFTTNNSFGNLLEIMNETLVDCSKKDIKIDYDLCHNRLDQLMDNLNKGCGQAWQSEQGKRDAVVGKKSELDNLVQKIKDTEGERLAVQGEVDGLKGRKREMMAEFEELEKNVEKLRGQKEVYDEGERQTQGMYGELLRQQSKLEVDEANFLTRNKAMEDTVANLKQSIDGLYGTVEGEKDTTSKLEDQLQKAKSDLEYWERSLFQVKNKNKELLTQKETLDGRVEDLKESIKTHESNISEVATLVGLKETSLATLEHQLKSHSDNLISLNTTHTHLEAKSESFKSEIVTVTDQHSELTSIIDTLKSEVSKLHTVKNSNNETWTNYIQEIIKSCKKLTGECHS